MAKVLILIPCSGSKKKGGISICSSTNSILNYLTASSKERLLCLRKRLFEYFPFSFGIKYMEACKRYTGHYSQIYRQISPDSWDILEKNPNLDLVIVSALYGLLRYDEQIRYYDTSMNDKIGKTRLKTWWRNNALCAILKDYINKNNISEVHNVLSNDYNEAIRDCFVDVKLSYFCHDFSKYKSGSNAHRGKNVNKFIQNF